jgi:hypothetical protein
VRGAGDVGVARAPHGTQNAGVGGGMLAQTRSAGTRM